jgi:hypothetical protein
VPEAAGLATELIVGAAACTGHAQSKKNNAKEKATTECMPRALLPKKQQGKVGRKLACLPCNVKYMRGSWTDKKEFEFSCIEGRETVVMLT